MRLRKRILVNVLYLLKNLLNTVESGLPNEGQVKKILIFGYTGLGNCILLLPTIRTLRKYYKNSRISFLHGGDTGCFELLFDEGIIDDFILIRRTANWFKRLKWIFKIRKEGYDLVVSDFHHYSFFPALVIVFSNIKFRVGHVSSGSWVNDWDSFYNIKARMRDNQHELERDLELVRALGIKEDFIKKDISLKLNKTYFNFARNFLKDNNIQNDCKIVSIHFGTGKLQRWKQWNLRNFKILTEEIIELPNTAVILHGTAEESDMIASATKKMVKKPIVAAGKTSIREAAALIKMSHLFIGNDSALMHIAAAVKTPVIAIYGPTDLNRTAPIGNAVIIKKNLPCMPCYKLSGSSQVESCPNKYKCLNSITVEEVYSAVRDKIGQEEVKSFQIKYYAT